MKCSAEDHTLFISSVHNRKLISHFAKKVPAGIGGGTECCDNCKRGYRCSVIC